MSSTLILFNWDKENLLIIWRQPIQIHQQHFQINTHQLHQLTIINMKQWHLVVVKVLTKIFVDLARFEFDNFVYSQNLHFQTALNRKKCIFKNISLLIYLKNTHFWFWNELYYCMLYWHYLNMTGHMKIYKAICVLLRIKKNSPIGKTYRKRHHKKWNYANYFCPGI